MAAVVALSVAGASAAATRPAKLDLPAFFIGRTHSDGQLRVALRRPVRHVVDSVGKRGANGELILHDTVREDGKPVKERRWVMRPTGPNAYIGTMTEAVGPVSVNVEGTKAVIRYKMKGGISIDQRLALQADGKTLSNFVTGRKLGVRVGRLEGTIRKLD